MTPASRASQRDLAIAFDFTSRDELFAALAQLGTSRPVLKLGLRLLPFLSPSDIADLKSRGFRIFIDAKLHDIPTQVGSAVKTWARFGADFLTIHVCGGRAMIREALANAKGTSLRVLGVSVLTSLDADDLKDIGIAHEVSSQVRSLVKMAKSEGLDSFVCSAQEIETLKKHFPGIYLVTPGLHIDESRRALDQKRAMHYREALSKGADMLVIGRAIWDSPSPDTCVHQVMGDL
jgi:orotidine-5'-phosphate decarboxylase